MIRIAKTNGVVRLPKAKNVLGGKLAICCTSPMTGFFRDGCCNTGPGRRRLAHGVRRADGRVPGVLQSRPATTSRRRICNGASPACSRATAGACAHRAGRKRSTPGYAPKVVLAATHEACAGVLRSGRSQSARGRCDGRNIARPSWPALPRADPDGPAIYVNARAARARRLRRR